MKALEFKPTGYQRSEGRSKVDVQKIESIFEPLDSQCFWGKRKMVGGDIGDMRATLKGLISATAI